MEEFRGRAKTCSGPTTETTSLAFGSQDLRHLSIPYSTVTLSLELTASKIAVLDRIL